MKKCNSLFSRLDLDVDSRPRSMGAFSFVPLSEFVGRPS